MNYWYFSFSLERCVNLGKGSASDATLWSLAWSLNLLNMS